MMAIKYPEAEAEFGLLRRLAREQRVRQHSRQRYIIAWSTCRKHRSNRRSSVSADEPRPRATVRKNGRHHAGRHPLRHRGQGLAHDDSQTGHQTWRTVMADAQRLHHSE